MRYDFDQVLDRHGTLSHKWDNMQNAFPDNPAAIPFWVADTDFACPRPIVEAVRKRAEHPIYGYSDISEQSPRLVADWQKRNGWEVDPSWVIFSNGVVPTLSAIVETFTEAKDGVIIQPPVYYPIREVVENNGRKVIENHLILENGRWGIDFEQLVRQAKDPDNTLMILCHPLNPVSRVLDKEELRQIGQICLENHLILVVDEIHSDLVFPHKTFYSLAGLDKCYEKITVTAVAPSKTFNIAGLQTSALIIPDRELFDMFQETMARKVYIPNLFGAAAFEAAYGDPECEEYLRQLLVYLWDNYLFLDTYLKENMPKIRCQKPDATYLLWLDCRELGLDDRELEIFYLKEGGIALDAGHWFGKGGSGFMRINIGCPRSLLEKGLDQLKNAYVKRDF